MRSELGLCSALAVGRHRPADHEPEDYREGAMNRWKSILAAGVLAVSGAASVDAAELVISSNQGGTPGVRELANAFSRQSGHKVTVVQETGAALEKRINEGPADLITSNPGPINALAQKGKIVAG